MRIVRALSGLIHLLRSRPITKIVSVLLSSFLICGQLFYTPFAAYAESLPTFNHMPVPITTTFPIHCVHTAHDAAFTTIGNHHLITGQSAQSGHLFHAGHAAQTGAPAGQFVPSGQIWQSHIGQNHIGQIWQNHIGQIQAGQSQAQQANLFHLNHNLVSLQSGKAFAGLNNVAHHTEHNHAGLLSAHLYNSQPSSHTSVSLKTASGANSNVSLLGPTSANNSALGLDLALTQAIIPASNAQPVTIIVGGHLDASGHIVGGMREVVTLGKMLTPAEYAAVQQVISSGQQTVLLNLHGAANGGVITLLASQAMSLSTVIIPKNVTVDAIGFSSKNPFDVTGSLRVSGTLTMLQNLTNIASSLDLSSLVVGAHGTISDSQLNNQTLFSNVFSSAGLNFNVLGAVNNSGLITSTNSVSIQSGGPINNLTVANQGQAIISAPNIALASHTGVINNSGQIIATTGNVQFNAPVNQDINIANTGTIQAVNGAINVRDSSYVGAANVNLTGGGDLLSQQVNIHTGSGAVNADIGNVTGQIATCAGSAQINANTKNLIIGSTNIIGDPSYFNSGGAVTIASALNFSGQNLAIVAKTNIITAAGAGGINTGSASGNGGNITMIAGAVFTNSGATSGSNDTKTTLTITGGSATGGYIDLNGSISGSHVAITSFNSSSTAANGNGGNINLIAYGGTGNSAGAINLPTNVTVNASGKGTGANGSVNVFAGGSSGTTISMGNIYTTGGTGSGGNITVATQSPIISGNGTMQILNGGILNGSRFTGGNTQSASIKVGTITASGSTVALTAGGNISATSITDNGRGANGNGGIVNIIAGSGTGNSGLFSSTGAIIADGIGTGTAGNINISNNSASAFVAPSTFAVGKGSVGGITITNNGSGGIQLNKNITTSGTLTMTSLNNGAVNVSTGVNLNGANVNVNTANLVDNGTITATLQNITLLGNGSANALNVSLGSAGILSAKNWIYFNNANHTGAVSINSGLGSILSNSVNFSGGGQAVSVIANKITGQIQGAGTSINIAVNNGNLNVGGTGLISSAGDINLSNNGNAGNISINGLVNSAGNLTITNKTPNNTMSTRLAGQIMAKSITINSAYALLAPSVTVVSSAGDINFQGNSAGLKVFGSGASSNIISSSNVNFDNLTAGTINLSGTANVMANNGSGLINFNGGVGNQAHTVNAIAKSLSGIVTGNGSTLTLSVTSSNVTVGVFNSYIHASSGNINITDKSANAAINVVGNITSAGTLVLTSGNAGSVNVGSGNTIKGTTLTINTPSLNDNGIVMASQGNLNIQSNATNHALVVNFGANSNGMQSQLLANAAGRNINFNNTTAGAVTINGGPNYGLISAANDVILNGGHGAINTNNNQIIGCIHVNGSSIAMQTAQGDLNFCIGINTSSTNSSGGAVSIAANGGALNINSITTNGSGHGNSAGSITLSAAHGMNIGTVNANGSNGASGSAVTLSSAGQGIVATYISATGGIGGNGGSVSTNSSTLILSGVNGAGNSIDVSSASTGNGGNVSITTTSSLAFTVGKGAITGNGTLGNIAANGVNGGFITLTNYGNASTGNQIINGLVMANGTTGIGGMILFQGQQPNGSAQLITTIYGDIEAMNNADNQGIIGFNAGQGQNVTLIGTGFIEADSFVRIGNLNTSTLDLLSQRAGIITIDPRLTIHHVIQSNGFIPNNNNPNVPPVPPVVVRPILIASISNPLANYSRTAVDDTPVRGYVNFNRNAEEIDYSKEDQLAYLIQGVKVYESNFEGSQIERLTSSGVKLAPGTAKNYLDIDKGNVLIATRKKVVVGTHEGTISIAPGAVVFVMESGADVVIYDLRQGKPSQVSVTVNKRKIAMHPGCMLVLTRQRTNSFERLNVDCHFVAYRSAREMPLNEEDVKVFAAEFSIPSAFLSVQPLNQLIASNDHQDQIVFNEIVKGAAILGDFAGTVQPAQLANMSRQL